MTTDKLRSYAAAKREMMPSVGHCQDKYANNRAEVSHEHTREQERQMRGFRSPGQAQRFLSVHRQSRHGLHEVEGRLHDPVHLPLLEGKIPVTPPAVTAIGMDTKTSHGVFMFSDQ